MSRVDFIKMDGVVNSSLPGNQFSVTITGGQVLRCRLSGNMKQNKIRVLPGDKVAVEISPYDVTQGCIVYRFK